MEVKNQEIIDMSIITNKLNEKNICYGQSHLTNDKSSVNWVQDDAQIITWLWNSMEPHVSSNVMFMSMAKEIWHAFSVMHSSNKILVRIFKLLSKIMPLK